MSNNRTLPSASGLKWNPWMLYLRYLNKGSKHLSESLTLPLWLQIKEINIHCCFVLVGAHQCCQAGGLPNLLLRRVQSSISSASSTQTCGSCWLGTTQQFYHDVCGEGGSQVTSKLKQEAHIDQPTSWPLSHICAQPYHVGSGSHGQLFRPYWGSPVWHSSSYKNSLSKSLIQLCDSCQPNLITSVSINDI